MIIAHKMVVIQITEISRESLGERALTWVAIIRGQLS